MAVGNRGVGGGAPGAPDVPDVPGNTIGPQDPPAPTGPPAPAPVARRRRWRRDAPVDAPIGRHVRPAWKDAPHDEGDETAPAPAAPAPARPVPAAPAPARPVPAAPAGGGRSAVDVWWGLGSLAVYCGLAVGVYWYVWSGHPTTATVGGPDSDLVSWFLSYVGEAVIHGRNPFFTTYANYPYGVNLLANSSSPFLGFLGTPITAAFGGVATFNVMTTASLATSAGSAYLLIRRFVAWHPAAFLGGLLYGFSPYMIIESGDGHLQMAFVAVPPLIFLVLHDALVRLPGRWVRNGLLLAVLVVVQFFISAEVLATTALIAVVVVVVAAIVGRRRARARARPLAASLGLGCGLGACALAYPAWYALKGPGHITGPLMPIAEAFRSDLVGFILPNSVERISPTGHLLAIAQSLGNGPGENSSYLGIPLVVLLIAGVVWCWRDGRVLVVAAGVLAAAVLSLGGALAIYKAPQIGVDGDAVGKIPLPEALLHKIGPFQSIIPVRFSLYVFLGTAIVLAVVAERCRRTWSRHWGGVAGTVGASVLAVAVCVPLIPQVPLNAAAPIGVPAYFVSTVHRQIPAGSVGLIYPYPSGLAAETEAWLAYSDLPFRTPGGYFLVPGPTGKEVTDSLLDYTRTTPLGDWMHALAIGKPDPQTPAWKALLDEQLRLLHIRSVVAVPTAGSDPAGAVAALTWLLGRPSAEQGQTVDWYHVTGGT